MRYLYRVLLVALVTINSFAFFQQPSVEAGSYVQQFNSVSFTCPGVIDFAGQWYTSTSRSAYVRIYDPNTATLLDDIYFSPAGPSVLDYFSGSFNLAAPLPASVRIDLYAVSPVAATTIPVKPFGLAEIYNPPNTIADGLSSAPPLPPGTGWTLLDTQLITIPECASIAGCDATFTIYGTALVLDQQLGYSEPNGEPARDLAGNLIWVLHDVDEDGQDTYLIVDIQTGIEGETWLGIFIGACNPVYVPLNKVYPLNAIPVD